MWGHLSTKIGKVANHHEASALKVIWPFDHMTNVWPHNKLKKLHLMVFKLGRVVTSGRRCRMQTPKSNVWSLYQSFFSKFVFRILYYNGSQYFHIHSWHHWKKNLSELKIMGSVRYFWKMSFWFSWKILSENIRN